MPELPEVETVRQTLALQLGHPTITDIRVAYPRVLDNCSVEAFQQRLIGKQLQNIDRIGKYLIFDFKEEILVSHLRMEGKYYVEKRNASYDEKHTHVFIEFDDGRQLRYHDTRKFGRMCIYERNQPRASWSALQHVGYDVFDEALTSLHLYNSFHSRSIVLKQALLDQSVMAGVGNIYADEICFAMKMHPETKVAHLRKRDYEELLYQTRRILAGAIKAGGTTIRSYTSSLGVDGRFQLQLKVHAKKEEACPICQSLILKTKVATRGTYYCPSCQRRR